MGVYNISVNWVTCCYFNFVLGVSVVWLRLPWINSQLLSSCLDKNYNIFQTTRFKHTMIFFKLTDYYKLSDIYISHNNCLGHMLIT